MQAVASSLCAVCARRPSSVVDRIDGRVFWVCVTCRDESVPAPPRTPNTRERLLQALGRSYGLDIVELAQALGEDTELGRAKLSAALARAVRDGLVTYSGGRMDRIYSLTDKAATARR